MQPNVKRGKEMNIRIEISEIGNRNSIEKIYETKCWFFEKNNKIDNTLARLTKKKRERVNTDY